MTDSTANLAAKLEERFSNELIHCITDRDQVTLILSAEDLLSVCKVLRDDEVQLVLVEDVREMIRKIVITPMSVMLLSTIYYQ